MASSTIIQCSSSYHAIKTHEYDVFVSFRGEDTRNSFTGFLFEALRKNGIDAFKDNEHLKKGESIAPELLQAIQGSRIFVVVFSKNYASSTWCLRELVEICNCIETSPRQLLPIFYDVDPSEVRKQSGCFEQAFSKHEETFRKDKQKMEEVLRWTKTLSKVADFSGWHIGNKPQYAVIDEIAQTIKEKLGSKFSSLPKDNLVGMESRVEELARRLLHLGSVNDVRFLGISGMCGVGKTTLARALYEQISHQYDAHCFIDDVSETYRKYSGALGVQKQLLSQSLKEKNIEICNVSEGTQLVFSRLRKAKGLIVFDNVDQVEQLNIFSGNRQITMLRECLGGDSTVIIVSRDEHILKAHGVDDICKVKPLNPKDAIQLFCIKAFKCNYIISDYEKLTHAILSHAEGHPLTIEVIGSSLFGKNIPQWESTLAKLRNNRSENIMDKLRIGFDELDGTNKELFLDIACFFGSGLEPYGKEILYFRGFYPDLGLQVLIDKSLITINLGFICMHKLLRNLGKYIVSEKSPNEPSKWSRLWDFQDLCKVMSDNMEETNIEAIVVDAYSMMFSEATIMTVNALSKMRNLKLLIIPQQPHIIKYSGSLNVLSNELGYLRWPNFPSECLPLCFEPHKLVDLVLRESNIKQLWESTKALPKLRYLDLSHSKNLIKIQNLSEAINLQHLDLQGCTGLKQIDESSIFPKNLTRLNLKDCRNLICLPDFREAVNLESIDLEGCTGLKQIDESSIFPKNLTRLNLKDCRNLISLPHFREALNLESIDLEGCTKLRQIDSSIGLLRKLSYLNLRDCKSLVSIPNSILELKSLKYLCLFGCSQLYSNQLLEEPRDEQHSKKLCTGEAPSHSQYSTRTESLYSREQNQSVNWMLPSLSVFSCMVDLDLSFCNLVQVPNAIGNLHSLQKLSLRGNNFAVVPSLKELSKLVHLNLQHCKRLEYLPELPSRIDMPSSSSIISFIVPTEENAYGLNIFNCPELGKRKGWSSMCFQWIMQIVKAYHKYKWIYRTPRVSSIILGSEIPRWFNSSEHACTDNLIRIDASEVMHDKDLIGVACSVIFVARNQREMVPPKNDPLDLFIPLLFREDIVTVESDHLWLFYLSRSALNDFLEPIVCEGYDVKVKKYAYRFVYERDVQQSNSTLMRSETSLPQKRKFSAIQEIE